MNDKGRVANPGAFCRLATSRRRHDDLFQRVDNGGIGMIETIVSNSLTR